MKKSLLFIGIIFCLGISSIEEANAQKTMYKIRIRNHLKVDAYDLRYWLKFNDSVAAPNGAKHSMQMTKNNGSMLIDSLWKKGKKFYKKMVNAFEKYSQEKKFKDLNLTYSIGGQISFDVFPKGWDKTYCLRYLDESEFEAIGGTTYSWDLHNKNGIRVASGSYVLIAQFTDSSGRTQLFRRMIGVKK